MRTNGIMDDYKKHFPTQGSKNWLKGSVAVNITKRGLASFACNVCDEIRVNNLKIALKQSFPDLCGNCSIVEAIPCDPTNNICNARKCRFHNRRVFRPCLIVKCNNYRYTISDKIIKGLDIGVTCKSCSTPEIVHCNPRNKVCNSGRCKFHLDPNTKNLISYRPCLKNICDSLRNAIEHTHRFSNPSWKNTDTRKWCVNAWDIAKCFMPPDGYADVDNEDDTDLNGIISVFINCKEIQHYFTADLSNSQNICVKVREVGKRLRHAPGLDIPEADLKNWFSDLKALFRDPTFYTACPYAQISVDQLEQLDNDDITIERSEIIAAIKDSVNYLKSLRASSDLEALADIRNQIDILDKKIKEISAEGLIQMERATKAGVIDIVHATEEGREHIREEVDRGISSIRESSETSGIAIDEFKTELKKNLISYHQEYNSTLTLGPFFELDDTKLEDFYVPPKIVKLDPSTIDNVKEGHECTTETITTLDQLFDSKKSVVITADAGVGKTSFCKYLTVLWCAEQDENDEIISKFKTFHNFPRDSEYLKHMEDIIFAHTKLVYSGLERTNKAFDELLSKEKGLIFLDGLDEPCLSSLHPLPANRKYIVFITMRTWKLANITLPSKRSYQSAQIELMDETASRKLVCHANDCLNRKSGTLYDIEDFISAVKNHYVETLLVNPMFSMQLLCVYHDRRNATRTKSASPDGQGDDGNTATTSYHRTRTDLGRTRSHIFAHIIEIMLQNVKESRKGDLQRVDQSNAMANNMRDSLPMCFRENTLIYNEFANFILHIGKLAFNCLFNEHKNILWEHEIEMFLSSDEIDVLLKSGLLSATKTGKCTSKSIMYCFLHQTYMEMLASVYLSSLDIEGKEWQMFEQRFGIKVSPDMLSFLCVMNYKQGCRCFDIYQTVESTFLTGFSFQIDKLKNYQSCIQMAYEECRNNGIDVPQLFLKHALLGKPYPFKLDPALLQKSYIDLESITFITHIGCQELLPIINSQKLKLLLVYKSNLQCSNNMNLSLCKHLSEVIILDSKFPDLIVNPISLEKFVVYVNQDLFQNLPQIKVSFAVEKQFSSSLQKLLLINVVMDAPLDLKQCQNLRVLVVKSSSFTDQMHLDLSGLTNLSKIIIRNNRLAHLTINPSFVQEVWIRMRPELIQELSPMKVSFEGGEQFSCSLERLSLANVVMEAPLDLLQCQNLRELLVDNMSFTEQMQLDLSSLTNLSKITTQNNRLAYLTINPSFIEEFWIGMRQELIQELAPVKVSFERGEQFSYSLQRLCLVNVIMEASLDFSQCQNLRQLLVDHTSFTDQMYLDLSGLTNLSKITIQNNRLSRLTINPSFVQEFWIDISPELIQEFSPMKISFEGGEQFSCSLQRLCLANVIMEAPLDLLQCQNLRELYVDNMSFTEQMHLDLSSLTNLDKINVRDSRLAKLTINPSFVQ